MSGSQATTLTPWLHEFVAASLCDDVVEKFVRHVNDGILAQTPEIADDPLLLQDLDTGTRAQWRAFLGVVTDADYHHDLPAQAGSLARSLARRGMDLGILLKIYRAANQLVFQYFSEVVRQYTGDSPSRDEVLIFIWSRAGQWIDDSIELLIETFYEERRRVHQGTRARRTAMIEALLHGSSLDVDEATRELGHALRDWQTALVIWADDSGHTTDSDLLDVCALAADALAAAPALAHVVGTHDARCWIATPDTPDLDALTQLEAPLRQRGMRMAVGGPSRGVIGFRDSHAEAVAAHRISTSAVRCHTLVSYRDVELPFLVANNREFAERMVLREVGPLCAPDKNLTPIRETVRTFLANRDTNLVARKLFVHKNTVRYRLNRAEELIGHPLTERSGLVELALRYIEVFGAPDPRER
ncbi:helix-turn-helix domain-containing protein [Saccharopolyspora sp. HNM0983]|uniref:Helix-turn-helix domain-containing protein n=1 Tax=Saccharopolyspora montiporae TaxID=2781240 RepID=A0A929FYN2_9PSEU|nr:helix-turn-helix domain-containing protein [Saccharopolyspora sp. HNM0983]MBE9372877.1 helix-turn-helix domain-containing protein [Saccharopolyspora sp. HNM0983]